MVDSKIDDIDIKILQVLQTDGRVQKHALAEAVNLSPSPCAVRLRRLEDLGYIEGYSAIVDISKFLDLFHVTVLVKLDAGKPEAHDEFCNYILDADEILTCDAIIGEVDYILHFVGLDAQHYQSFFEKTLDTCSGIQSMIGHLTSRKVKNDKYFPVVRAAEWQKNR